SGCAPVSVALVPAQARARSGTDRGCAPTIGTSVRSVFGRQGLSPRTGSRRRATAWRRSTLVRRRAGVRRSTDIYPERLRATRGISPGDTRLYHTWWVVHPVVRTSVLAGTAPG